MMNEVKTKILAMATAFTLSITFVSSPIATKKSGTGRLRDITLPVIATPADGPPSGPA